ncbi:hypothetical protein [Actinophytocola oryzae]|uniref:Uncharacterized protein YukE n=1 Tax=Actinophytocola oryzae TaxID=502181 RepID=A0A4R7UNM7_9PSEU|nr:hypothetical protein [Actinophytocola oryzae]TDV34596.1 uncharacterized protein YukE [Actinophytocola oryzae]
MVRDDGFILYNHDLLHQTVQDMFNANTHITEQMLDLAGQVQKNKEFFLGDTSESYGLCSDDIAAKLEESTETLHRVAGNVKDGSEELEHLDHNLAKLF